MRPGPPQCVALFDLDGTLTWRDTLLPFVAGYVMRHPARSLELWRLPSALLRYATAGHDHGLLKSNVIRITMGGESRSRIDDYARFFVDSLMPRGMFRPAALAILEAHRKAGDHLVLLSASPDLYVPKIGKLLGFDRTLCTEVAWDPGHDGEESLDGALVTPNRRGEEKCRCLSWLRQQYAGLPIIAYGNSASDLPHLVQADRAILVNGDAATRHSAKEMGLAVGEWR